jgi:hypothetical protein
MASWHYNQTPGHGSIGHGTNNLLVEQSHDRTRHDEGVGAVPGLATPYVFSSFFSPFLLIYHQQLCMSVCAFPFVLSLSPRPPPRLNHTGKTSAIMPYYCATNPGAEYVLPYSVSTLIVDRTEDLDRHRFQGLIANDWSVPRLGFRLARAPLSAQFGHRRASSTKPN